MFLGVKEEEIWWSSPSIYPASFSEMDKPFSEWIFDSLSKILASIALLPIENAGFLGKDNGILSFVNIDSTFDIVGQSIALSCTHNRLTWIHLSIWYLTHESLIAGSNSSTPSPSCHKSHPPKEKGHSQLECLKHTTIKIHIVHS